MKEPNATNWDEKKTIITNCINMALMYHRHWAHALVVPAADSKRSWVIMWRGPGIIRDMKKNMWLVMHDSR